LTHWSGEGRAIVGMTDRQVLRVIRHHDAGNALGIDRRLAGAHGGVSRREIEQGYLAGAESEAWVVFERRTQAEVASGCDHLADSNFL
jgi:hypothetical protein